MVTSPPYFNAREYSQWETYDDYLDFLKEVFSEVQRVLKEGRICVVNLSPILVPRAKRNAESTRYPIPFDFSSIMTRELGFKFLEDIIWAKPEYTVKNRIGNFMKHRKPIAYKPNLVHEYVLVYQKPCDFLIDKILRANPERVSESLIDTYERTSIWNILPKKDKEHPAVFPNELVNNIITYYSLKGDLVLDIFMGSGTTALECLKLDRHYLGFEKETEYFNVSIKRINQLKKESRI